MTVAGARALRATDPTTLGGYQLLGRLGEGGMGVVYLGQDPAGKLVAVKAIRTELADEPDFRRRFRGEVERARQVPPYCTAEVLGADPDSDPPYLVVEYVDGPSLADVVGTRGPLSTANLHSVAIGVATALTAIHGAGVIHRDLKPGNVLLAPGSLKVIDFGIARPVVDASTLTDVGEIVGTVAYMAPERLGSDGSRALTPAADVFAWGAVVAFAGTGRVPFRADSLPGTAMKILHDEPELDGLAPALYPLVVRALAKDPKNRPTARALLEMLTGGQGLPPGAAPPTVVPPVRPQRPAGPPPAAPVAQAPAAAHTPAAPATQLHAAHMGSAHGPTALRPADPPTQPQPVFVPVRQRSPWGVVAAILAAVLTLVLAGAIATNTIRLPFLNPAANPSTSSSVTPSATASASPSASASASPSASASASTSASPSAIPAKYPPDGMKLQLKDTLRPPVNWVTTENATLGVACTADKSGLTVSRTTQTSYRCPGPTFLLAYDMAVFTKVRLFDAASCAGIWLRFDAQAGYLVEVCQDGFHVMIHGRPNSNSLSQVCPSIPAPLALNQDASVGVIVRGSDFTFLRDGKPIGRACHDDSAQFVSGHVVLGIYPVSTVPIPPPSSRVRFTDVEIWTGTG